MDHQKDVRADRDQYHAAAHASSNAKPQTRGVVATGIHGATQRRIGELAQRRANVTGLPNALKAGVERLSGRSLDDVRVHYNSSKPAAIQAHAFTQGNDIHVAAGQEQHLPHEAWHVVQQAEGRVKPTTEIGGISVNDSASLEREADIKGAAAQRVTNLDEERLDEN